MSACLSVLVVEDDPSIRGLLHEVLRAEGLDVYLAADGNEALALSQKIPRPCVLLVDVHMPRLDGEGFLRLLRARDAFDDPAILVSAAPDVAQRAEALKVAAYFSKPFELEKLILRVTALAAPDGKPSEPSTGQA